MSQGGDDHSDLPEDGLGGLMLDYVPFSRWVDTMASVRRVLDELHGGLFLPD